MRIRIYLKSGQVLKLRGVKDMEFTPSKRISWECHGRWSPLYINPDEIVAVTKHKEWHP